MHKTSDDSDTQSVMGPGPPPQENQTEFEKSDSCVEGERSLNTSGERLVINILNNNTELLTCDLHLPIGSQVASHHQGHTLLHHLDLKRSEKLN